MPRASPTPTPTWLAPVVRAASPLDSGAAALRAARAGGTGWVATPMTVPRDDLLLPRAGLAPFIVPDAPGGEPGGGVPRSVLAWRHLGPWVQCMDPLEGRRWHRTSAWLRQLPLHESTIAAADWQALATAPDRMDTLRRRLRRLGMPHGWTDRVLHDAAASPQWTALATIDAATRHVEARVCEGSVRSAREARRLVDSLFRQCEAQPHQRHHLVPASCWAVWPDPGHAGGIGPWVLRQRGVRILLLSPDAGRASAGRADAPASRPGPAPRTATSIRCSGVSVVVEGQPILPALDLRIEAGEHVAILGPAGSGKSTLLGLLGGRLLPTTGALYRDGRLVLPASAVHTEGSVLAVPPADGPGAGADDERCAAGATSSLRQSSPRLVTLDDPVSGLGSATRQQRLAELRRQARRSTLLFATRDAVDTQLFARVLVIEQGRIVEDGAPVDLMRRHSRYRASIETEGLSGLAADGRWLRAPAARDPSRPEGGGMSAGVPPAAAQCPGRSPRGPAGR